MVSFQLCLFTNSVFVLLAFQVSVYFVSCKPSEATDISNTTIPSFAKSFAAMVSFQFCLLTKSVFVLLAFQVSVYFVSCKPSEGADVSNTTIPSVMSSAASITLYLMFVSRTCMKWVTFLFTFTHCGICVTHKLLSEFSALFKRSCNARYCHLSKASIKYGSTAYEEMADLKILCAHNRSSMSHKYLRNVHPDTELGSVFEMDSVSQNMHSP